MPFAYGPMPRPYTEQANPLGNALAVIGGVQNIQTRRLRNQLAQDELMKRKRTEEALSGVDWNKPESLSEAIKKVMAVNPKVAMDLMEVKQKGTKQQLDFMKAAGNIAETFLPAMRNNPMAYKTFHENYATPMGLGDVLPKFETFLSPDGKNIDWDRYNAAVTYVGSMTRLAQAERDELKPYTLGPGSKRFKYNQATGKHEVIAETPFRETPQTYTYDEGGNVEPLGEPGQKFVRRPKRVDLTPKAHELAMKDVQNKPAFAFDPESPEAKKYYESRFNFHKRALGIKEGAGTPTKTTGFTKPGYYRGPDGKEVKILNEEEYKRVFGR